MTIWSKRSIIMIPRSKNASAALTLTPISNIRLSPAHSSVEVTCSPFHTCATDFPCAMAIYVKSECPFTERAGMCFAVTFTMVTIFATTSSTSHCLSREREHCFRLIACYIHLQ